MIAVQLALMYRRLPGPMNIVKMIFKTYQMFKILLFCVLTYKTDGVYITTTATTKVNGMVGSWETADVMDYTIDVNKYNLDLSGITSLVFELKRCGRAHVLLSSSDVRNSAEPLYEFSIGYKTYYTFIIYRPDDSLDPISRKYVKFLTPDIYNCTVYLPFWISWADGDLKLGTGIFVGDNVLGILTNQHPFEVKSIGVLTDYGRIGNWRIHFEVSDKLTGYFDSCSLNNTKGDLVVVDDMTCSKLECAMICDMSSTCFGFNFFSTMTRCELLSFRSDVLTDVPHNIEAGWKFYSKCVKGKTTCLGCF